MTRDQASRRHRSHTCELSDDIACSFISLHANMGSASSFAVHPSELDGTGARATIPGIVIMLVVYRTGGHEQQEFNEVTMSNVKPESFRYAKRGSNAS